MLTLRNERTRTQDKQTGKMKRIKSQLDLARIYFLLGRLYILSYGLLCNFLGNSEERYFTFLIITYISYDDHHIL